MERLITVSDRLYDGKFATIRNAPLWMVEIGHKAHTAIEYENAWPKLAITKRFVEAKYGRREQ